MLRQAGLQLVSASAHSRANYAEAMLCNEQRLYVNDCATPFNNRFNRLNKLARRILTGPRPNIGTDIEAEFRSIERSVQTHQDRAAAAEQSPRDIEVQASSESVAA